MLNITVAGTTLSSCYLSDPALFLREQRGRAGAEDAAEGVRVARRELRALVADIDETSTAGQTRGRMLSWLGCFGWRFPTSLPGVGEAVSAHPADGADDLVWVLISPAGQHLDAAPSGRRAGRLRPQRQAEVCAREGTLPAVLLSNGSELRVIRRDPGLGGEASYLTVDLAGLAELGDDHEWRVLWALLRPEAFTPDADGKSLWDRVEDASTDAATAVSENLSGGVRRALSALANGALTGWRRLAEPIPAPRDLFADALKIAYRLLFVSYAEDRGLLPVGTPAYDQGYSLRGLRRQIVDPASVWTPDGGFLWASLRAQWRMLRDGVDAGELQITAFDGALFDPDKCPLLDDEDLTIGDTFVRDVIDALSYTEPVRNAKGKEVVGRRPVNYRELGVEQLGSIYEGLLSFEPQIADVPKVLARVGRGQSAVVQVLDADRVPDGAEVVERYDTGAFYLFEATGQRKGSGSYYTARPLAHFVVGETLRPLTENATSEQILSLRICDPAMGSGAFLVPAVHRLTEAYGEALAREGELLDHIDSREQFLLLVAGVGGSTDPLPFTSDVSQLEHLLDLERRTLPIPRITIEALAPETLAIPDTRDAALLELMSVIYTDKPYLLDEMSIGGWRVDWGREFHLDDDKSLFASDGTGVPMREGKHIHQYVHDFAMPVYHLKEDVGDKALVNRARKRSKRKNVRGLRRERGERFLSSVELRQGTLELPVDQFRPCFRETARGRDERTLIAAVLPPGTAVAHTVHYFYRSSFDLAHDGYRTVLSAEAMVYVVALINSLVWDFLVRRKASLHVTKSIMATLPIADVSLKVAPGVQIVALSGRLTCRVVEFDELAEVLGVECEPLPKDVEYDLRG
ncbi:hypothetical protein AB0M95_29800 [Sphaerisporangium sp. NPDC051017]|uniref:hypothetical protein n=1 Tax=Sphaerisporangium sp. NPDC051017 TaxID=3154636 RepID=UPI003419CA95